MRAIDVRAGSSPSTTRGEINPRTSIYGSQQHEEGTNTTGTSRRSVSESTTETPRMLLARVHEAIRVRNYSVRTEEAYAYWIRRYIYQSGRRHPRDLGPDALTNFLTALAVQHRCSASTQS